MHALAPPPSTEGKRDEGLFPDAWRRSANGLSRPELCSKFILGNLRSQARAVLQIIDAADAAGDLSSLNLAALGLALHAGEICILARQLGGAP